MICKTGYEIYVGKCTFSERHSHYGDRDNWNIVLTTAGEAKLTLGGQKLAMTPGSAFLIQPGPVRIFSVAEAWTSYWVHFNLDAHIPIAPEWPQLGDGVCAVSPERDDLAGIIELFGRLSGVCALRRHGWYLLAYCMVQELILRGNMAAHSALGEHIGDTAKMLENIRDDWHVDEIAQKCAMSRTGFFSKFKSTFGTTPVKYREQQLMTQVQSHLENSDMSLKEIAETMKLGSPSYLSTRFKRAFGLSPREYRRKHRGGES